MHDRVAGRERRRDLPDRHQHRVVPRRDGADDAERLAQYEVHDAGFRVRNRAFELVDALGHEPDRLDDGRQVDADHVRNRLAHVERLEHGERPGVGVDQVREAVKDFHAASRRHARPDARTERALRGVDGAIDVLAVAG
jgi:hypothetical protein